jgi:MerR family transcriptional regulator, heat shock protein HspR
MARRREDRKRDARSGGGDESKGRGRTRISAEFDQKRGVFMISVAAELAEMHPQTLRMYEARGLIAPQRSPKNTRLYSYEDVERLRRIQRMTVDEGLNLAGVESVLALERELERARSELGRMRRRAAEIERAMEEEIERVKRSFRAEIVPYGKYEATEIAPSGDAARVQIPIERSTRRAAGSQQDHQVDG